MSFSSRALLAAIVVVEMFSLPWSMSNDHRLRSMATLLVAAALRMAFTPSMWVWGIFWAMPLES